MHQKVNEILWRENELEAAGEGVSETGEEDVTEEEEEREEREESNIGENERDEENGNEGEGRNVDHRESEEEQLYSRGLLPMKVSKRTVYRWMQACDIKFVWDSKSYYTDRHEDDDIIAKRNVYLFWMKVYRLRMHAWVPSHLVSNTGAVSVPEPRSSNVSSKVKEEKKLNIDRIMESTKKLMTYPDEIQAQKFIDVDAFEETSEREKNFRGGGCIWDFDEYKNQQHPIPFAYDDWETSIEETFGRCCEKSLADQRLRGIQTHEDLYKGHTLGKCICVNRFSRLSNKWEVIAKGEAVRTVRVGTVNTEQFIASGRRIYQAAGYKSDWKPEYDENYKRMILPHLFASKMYGTNIIQTIKEGRNPSNDQSKWPKTGNENPAIWLNRFGPPPPCPTYLTSNIRYLNQSRLLEQLDDMNENDEYIKRLRSQMDKGEDGTWRFRTGELDKNEYDCYDKSIMELKLPSRPKEVDKRRPCEDCRFCRCRLPMIHIGTDEIIYYQHQLPKRTLSVGGKTALRPKSEGYGVMISGFTTEVMLGLGLALTEQQLRDVNIFRKLKYGEAVKELKKSPGMRDFKYGHTAGKEGMWTNALYMEQLSDCLDALECIFPSYQILVETDNSGPHGARPKDALSAKKMNFLPGSKKVESAYKARDALITEDCLGPHKALIRRPGAPENEDPMDVTLKPFEVQRSCFPENVKDFHPRERWLCDGQGKCSTPSDRKGQPKGTRQLLWERGWISQDMTIPTADGEKKITAPLSQNKLSVLPDYLIEESIFEEEVRKRGHVAILSPPCHPELAGNGIEWTWGFTKKHYRQSNLKHGKTKGFDKFVERVLASLKNTPDGNYLPLQRIYRFGRRSRDYGRVYEGKEPFASKLDIERIRKVVKSHRSAYDGEGRTYVDAEYGEYERNHQAGPREGNSA